MNREYIAGTISIDGIRVGHTRYELEVLESFLIHHRPLHFIEIGVHEGGLSYILIPILSTIHCNYTGVEINCDLVTRRVKSIYEAYKATLLCMDCFSYEFYSYVNERTPKVLYCDGGAKAREIAYFYSILQPGDVIMCHDFYGFDRIPAEIPEYQDLLKEVVESDVQIYEKNPEFERLPEVDFMKTRIVGWKKL